MESVSTPITSQSTDTLHQFNWKTLLVLGGIGLMVLLRFVYLGADSPQGPFWVFDEGHWVHNARNVILFKRWIVDDFNQGLVAPVFTALSYAVFWLFGLGLIQARLVSVSMGVLALAVFYHWLKTAWNREDAAITTLLLGASSILFDYNRLALPESTVLFFLILSGYFWSRSSTQPVYGLATGAAFVVACLAKPTALFFFVVPIAVWLLRPVAGQESLPLRKRLLNLLRRPHRDPLGLFLLGCSFIALLGLAVAIALHLLPSITDMMLKLVWKKRPESLSRQAFRFVALPTRLFFRLIPALLMLNALYFMQRCLKKAQGTSLLKQCSPTELIALVWIAAGTLFVGSVSFYADRYLLVLIPPLSILAGKALSEAVGNQCSQGAEKLADSSNRWLKIAFTVAFFIPIFNALWSGLDFAVGNPSFNELPRDISYVASVVFKKYVIGSIGLILFAALFYRLLGRQRRRAAIPLMVSTYPLLFFTWAVLSGAVFLAGYAIPAGVKQGLSMRTSAALAMSAVLSLALVFVRTPLLERVSQASARARTLLLAGFLLMNGAEIGFFLSQPTFDVFTTAKQLSAYLGPDTVVLGDMADTLSLESKARSLRSYMQMNKNAYARFHPDYILDFQGSGSPHMSQVKHEHQEESYQFRFVQRYCLLPFDQKGNLYNFIVDLYAVEKRSDSVPF
jgi:hypothetical protein